MTEPPLTDDALRGAERQRMTALRGAPRSQMTPLAAVCALTFLCSIGTGVVWAGVPFIAKHEYGFSEQSTLWLFLTLGTTYVCGALSAGSGLRKFEQMVSPRGALAAILTISAVCSAALLFSRAAYMLWIVAISINIVMSWLWPIIESYVTAGRDGRGMRHAIGVWNLTWTSAVLASLFLLSPLVEHHARLALAGTTCMYAMGLLTLRWFSARPHGHGIEGNTGDEIEVEPAARQEYSQLLRSARLLLLMSYVLNSAMSPLLPFLIGRLEVGAENEPRVAATWTAARVLVMAWMWRVGLWHGRWGTLLAGGACMATGFVMILIASTLVMMFSGLLLMGAGMGAIYYAALYYAMTVGAAKVDAGGKHEALIGIGYTIGPAAGLIGLQFSDAFAHHALGPHGGVVIVVWSIMLVAAALAIRPFFAARRSRAA